MSFYFFFSIIPCLILTTAIAGKLLSFRATKHHLMATFFSLIPEFDAKIGEFVSSIAENSALLGWIGTISLLWLGGHIFDITDFALSKIWRMGNPRNWLSRRIFSMLMVILSGTLFAMGTLLSVIITAIRLFSIKLPGFSFSFSLKKIPFLWQGWLIALPFAVSFIMFTLIYKLSLGGAIPWRLAGVGGMMGATLFELVKKPFLFYMVHFSNYERLYGTLATMVILFFWVHISASIILLGAEFASSIRTVAGEYLAHKRIYELEKSNNGSFSPLV